MKTNTPKESSAKSSKSCAGTVSYTHLEAFRSELFPFVAVSATAIVRFAMLLWRKAERAQSSSQESLKKQ